MLIVAHTIQGDLATMSRVPELLLVFQPTCKAREALCIIATEAVAMKKVIPHDTCADLLKELCAIQYAHCGSRMVV